MRRHLPVLRPPLPAEPRRDELDRVAVSIPCTEPWEGMKAQGSSGVRFCGKCQQNVYDTSALTRGEVLLLLGKKDLPCVRLYRRPDGRLTTADCWSRLRRARAEGLGTFVRTVAILAWAFVATGVSSRLGGAHARAEGAPATATQPKASQPKAPPQEPKASPKEPKQPPKQPKKDPPKEPRPPIMGKMRAPDSR